MVALTLQSFEQCESDGEEGLTWDEVDACEHIYCGMLSVPCPTKSDFEFFDTNGDGTLTLEEYAAANGY